MRWNNLSSTVIYPGQTLQINHTGNVEKAPSESKPATKTEKNEAEKEKVIEEPTTTTGSYIVIAGDTLSEIAFAHNVAFEDILKWNNLSSTLIYPGQTLKVSAMNQSESKVDNGKEVVVEKPQTDTTEAKQAPKQTEEKKQETDAKDEAEEQSKVEVDESNEQAAEVSSETEEVTMTVTATAYTAECEGCTGITATGIDLNADRNKKVIAVDPTVIPLGTTVYVEGYGTAIAGDVGGAIKGNKIDIHVPTKEEAYAWGVRTVDIKILD